MHGSAKHGLLVWDLPTRLFHWSLALLVSLAWVTGGFHGTLWVVHRVSGYAVLALLLFRIAWGVFGGRHARFGDFVRGWASVKDYGRRLARLEPPEVIGHNPIGGWMIVIMLVMLAIIVVTGLFGTGHHGRLVGPLASMLSPSLAAAVGWIHGALSNFFSVVIAVHIGGVVVETLLTGDNLTRAMVNGRKETVHGPSDSTAAVPATVPAWRAALAICVAVVATWYMIGH